MQRGNVLKLFHSVTSQFVQEFLIKTMPIYFKKIKMFYMKTDSGLYLYPLLIILGIVKIKLLIQISTNDITNESVCLFCEYS